MGNENNNSELAPGLVTMQLTLNGLKKQLQFLEDNIALRKKAGLDVSFEESLKTAWERYLPGGSKHSKLGYSKFEEEQNAKS